LLVRALSRYGMYDRVPDDAIAALFRPASPPKYDLMEVLSKEPEGDASIRPRLVEVLSKEPKVPYCGAETSSEYESDSEPFEAQSDPYMETDK
jgi:hypothetical protein